MRGRCAVRLGDAPAQNGVIRVHGCDLSQKLERLIDRGERRHTCGRRKSQTGHRLCRLLLIDLKVVDGNALISHSRLADDNAVHHPHTDGVGAVGQVAFFKDQHIRLLWVCVDAVPIALLNAVDVDLHSVIVGLSDRIQSDAAAGKAERRLGARSPGAVVGALIVVSFGEQAPRARVHDLRIVAVHDVILQTTFSHGDGAFSRHPRAVNAADLIRIHLTARAQSGLVEIARCGHAGSHQLKRAAVQAAVDVIGARALHRIPAQAHAAGVLTQRRQRLRRRHRQPVEDGVGLPLLRVKGVSVLLARNGRIGDRVAGRVAQLKAVAHAELHDCLAAVAGENVDTLGFAVAP